MAANKNIADIFPILAISEQGLIINKNADITAGIRIQYPEVFCCSEMKYERVQECLIQAFKSLGEGFVIHKQDLFFEEPYAPKTDEKDIILQHNEAHFEGRLLLIHQSYLFISLPNTDPCKRKSNESSLFKAFYIQEKTLDPSYIQAFTQKVNTFLATLTQVSYLEAKLCTRQDMLGHSKTTGMLQHYFSLSFNAKSLVDIHTQKGLKIGEKHCHTLVINAIEQFPNQLYPHLSYGPLSPSETSPLPVSTGMSLGLNLRFNHIYNQIFYICPQKALKQQLNAEIKQHNAFLAWSADNQFALDEKLNFTGQLTAQNALAVRAHFNVMCFDESEERAKILAQEVESAIANLGFVPKKASTYAEQLYWAAIPGNASEIGIDNLSTCYLDNALSLFNLESNYDAA